MAYSDQYDGTIIEWCEWLDRIEDQVNVLTSYRFMYQYVRDVIQANTDLPQSHFLHMLSGMYVHSQALAVRRMVDTDTHTWSLRLLLEDIKKTPEAMSRARFLAFYGHDGDTIAEREWVKIGDAAFTERAGSGPHIDPGVVEQDIASLVGAAGSVQVYVNKHVAHYERDPQAPIPPFADLHSAIDEIHRLFEKYLLLLKSTSRAAVVPIFQYDWNAFFRVPWLKPGFDPPRPT